MGDGHVFQLVEEVLKPVQTALDTLFYAGVLYGATGFSIFLKKVANGIRTYFIPFGSYKRSDLSKRFGKWAVITCGTSEIGMAYAHEVSVQVEKDAPTHYFNLSQKATKLFCFVFLVCEEKNEHCPHQQ